MALRPARTQYIFLNRTQPPFDDVRVRQAFSYAVDRRRIAEIGGGQVACQMLPETFPGFRRNCPHQLGPSDGPYQGPDLAKARQLVAESATAGAKVTVHYSRFFGTQQDIARYAASVLTDLGYEVEVRPFPDRDLSSEDDFFDSTQVVLPLGWLADYLKPGTFYDFVASCTGSTFTRGCDPHIEAMATEARAIARSDPSGSLAMWAEVDHLLVDDAAMVATYTLVGKVVISPKIRNVVLRPGYGPILDQLWVK
jgi:peptide/nickel transport system substrate-binding protein